MKKIRGVSCPVHANVAFSAPHQNFSRQGPALGQVVYSCANPRHVALTFDDGPFDYTNQLLDILGRLGVKATFFLAGNNYGTAMDEGQWPAVVRRMDDHQHHIASHTWNHPDLETVSEQQRANEMQRNDQAFASILGKTPKYMRAPFLSCAEGCQQQMANLGYYIIDTNLDTKDYENNTPETNWISQQLFDDGLGAGPGSEGFIVLAHDVHRTTVTTLTEHMINTLRNRGFEPVTVGECLGDTDRANWYRAA